MGTHPIFESDFDCLTARMGFDGQIPSKLKLAELSRAPEPEVEQISFNYVVLAWPEVANQRSYIIEEKDEYGIGRVFVGASSSDSITSRIAIQSRFNGSALSEF